MDKEEVDEFIDGLTCNGCNTELSTNQNGYIYCPTCYDPFQENTDPEEWTQEEIERRLQ